MSDTIGRPVTAYCEVKCDVATSCTERHEVKVVHGMDGSAPRPAKTLPVLVVLCALRAPQRVGCVVFLCAPIGLRK